MTHTIPDEAVQAAVIAMNTNDMVAYDSLKSRQSADAKRILTAAMPFLQGVKVDRAKIEAARNAVEELANTHMCLTLEDWSRISSTILSALSSQPVEDGWLPTHRHKKRGTEYALIGVGKMQAENWQVSKDGFDHSIDMEEVVIYRSVDDGAIWVRPKSEFEDGRFETLPATPGSSLTSPTGGSNHGE